MDCTTPSKVEDSYLKLRDLEIDAKLKSSKSQIDSILLAEKEYRIKELEELVLRLHSEKEELSRRIDEDDLRLSGVKSLFLGIEYELAVQGEEIVFLSRLHLTAHLGINTARLSKSIDILVKHGYIEIHIDKSKSLAKGFSIIKHLPLTTRERELYYDSNGLDPEKLTSKVKARPHLYQV